MKAILRNLLLLIPLLCIMLSPPLRAACNANIPPDKPDARYVDNNDGTVTDTVTGLMWMQCPEGLSSGANACDTGNPASFTWQQAQQIVNEVNSANAPQRAGHADWRLPTLRELKSLSEMACYNPAINTDLFPHTPAGYFWSSTPVAGLADQAWSVGFFYGGDRWGKKDDARYVRLVRTARP